MDADETSARFVAKYEWRIDWANIPAAEFVQAASPAAPPTPRRSQTPSRSAEQDPSAWSLPVRSQPPPKPRAPLVPVVDRRAPRGTVIVGVLAVILLAAAAGGVIVLAGGGDQTTSSSAPTPNATAAGHLRRAFPAGQAFVYGGIRFNVVGNPNQAWARAVRGLDAGPGQRWVTVAVLYRNLSKRRVTVDSLRFRLQDERQRVYLPDVVTGNQGKEPPGSNAVPPGKLIHGQLAFRVRDDAHRFDVLIDATRTRRARVPITA